MTNRNKIHYANLLHFPELCNSQQFPISRSRIQAYIGTGFFCFSWSTQSGPTGPSRMKQRGTQRIDSDISKRQVTGLFNCPNWDLQLTGPITGKQTRIKPQSEPVIWSWFVNQSLPWLWFCMMCVRSSNVAVLIENKLNYYWWNTILSEINFEAHLHIYEWALNLWCNCGYMTPYVFYT